MKKGWILLFCLVTANTLYAQNLNITGRVIEETDTFGLAGVNIVLSPLNDTSQKIGTVSEPDGSFIISNIQPGQYKLRSTYVGFEPYERNITVTDQNIDLGTITLQTSATTLQSVVVQGQQVQGTQIGDTTQFNAGAFKTNPDASAEDLVTKMPGITSEDGVLKAQGEDVQEVLVDGKPFFGDDPNAAMRNLPAEVIDKVQVFDRQSDQAQFSGFDDGNTRKTINIITKPGKNTGSFGKAYAGYGTDNRYTAGGNINFFKGDQRISIVGLSNNINQQNFSSEDLLGVTANVRGQNRGGSGPRGEGRSGGRGSGGSQRGGFSRGGDAGNFLIGQQPGITQTHSIGLNYSDEWSKKLKVSGSYFFNHSNNDNNTRLTRQYITSSDSNLVYNENSFTETRNQNHRVNMRLDYTIDSFNSVLVTPRLSFQNNSYNRDLQGSSNIASNGLNSRIVNRNSANNAGYNLSNNILYRHKFLKRGRTVSVNLGTQLNNRNGDGSLYSLNEFFGSDTTLLDQRYDQATKGYTLSSDINYTEPVSERSQVMLSYSPSYTDNESDKQTFNLDAADQQYDILDTLLSNKFDNTYITHRGGVNFRHNDSNYRFNIGINGQLAKLEGHQVFPKAFDVERTFRNILPNAMFNYKFARTKNLRLQYRTSTSPPSITQLQNVVDITNPLLLRTGNPDLKQDYDHRIIARYSAVTPATSKNFFLMAMAQFTQNYIGNATFIPTKDTFFSDGLLVQRGSQLNMPANMDGYMNFRTFANYGFPVSAIKSNLNLRGGFSYNHIPALINNATNFSNSYNLNGGFTLGSNISENVDFTVTYSGNYNIVKNTLQDELDNTYYIHNAGLKFNWIFLDNFVFNTNLDHNLYTGLTQSFNQSFLLWNAALGYKFLQDRSLEARISAYDILKQNRSISREVTETYIEDSFTDVLQQYFLLTLTYTLRSFKQ